MLAKKNILFIFFVIYIFIPSNFQAFADLLRTPIKCQPGQTLLTVSNPQICGCSFCECQFCSYCGDGYVLGAEECDDGNQSSKDNCRRCFLPYCGDGVWNEIDRENGETCDYRDLKTSKGCRKNCTKCGDGIINDPSEECEVLPNGKTLPKNKPCRKETCKFKACGDGIIDSEIGETCEYQLPNSSSEFIKNCRKDAYACTYCGDGKIQAGVEECDDQNQVNGDGCSADCQVETEL